MNYGYIRPVTLYDDVDTQRLKISQHTDYIIEENHASNKKRIELDRLLNDNAQLSNLYITDLCILADSSKHLVDVLNHLKHKNIRLHIINLKLIIDGYESLTFLQTAEILSQFQSDIVKFRTKLGVEQSIKEGQKTGRPKRNDENLRRAIDMYLSKNYTLDEIKKHTNISRSTLYRHLDQ